MSITQEQKRSLRRTHAKNVVAGTRNIVRGLRSRTTDTDDLLKLCDEAEREISRMRHLIVAASGAASEGLHDDR